MKTYGSQWAWDNANPYDDEDEQEQDFENDDFNEDDEE